MGARQSKPHQGQKKLHKTLDEFTDCKASKEGAGSTWPSRSNASMATLRSGGGDANLDVNVHSFPSIASTQYIKEGTPRVIVRVVIK